MIKNPKFDDIRPYYEEEIPAAMQRIADSDVFPLLASFVYPQSHWKRCATTCVPSRLYANSSTTPCVG